MSAHFLLSVPDWRFGARPLFKPAADSVMLADMGERPLEPAQRRRVRERPVDIGDLAEDDQFRARARTSGYGRRCGSLRRCVRGAVEPVVGYNAHGRRIAVRDVLETLGHEAHAVVEDEDPWRVRSAARHIHEDRIAVEQRGRHAVSPVSAHGPV